MTSNREITNGSERRAVSFAAHSRTASRGRRTYPFAAVVGHDAAKRALLLLAIDPSLRGLLIVSESGSAKSTLARSFPSLLPDCESQNGAAIDARPVELPLNVSEDRLLGGLDLDRTIASGSRHVSRGLLAEAHGKVLYADDANLLDASAAAHVARALDIRQVQLEREGLSAIQPADFIFVGTYNPLEGEVSRLLRDRVALIVNATTDFSSRQRLEIIERNLQYETDADVFCEAFALETAKVKSEIQEARGRLGRVRVSRNLVRRLATIAMRLGVKGNRADVFAWKAARANAAIEGRDSVDEGDVVVAIQLVLLPRATVDPRSSDEAGQQRASSSASSEGPQAEQREDQGHSATGSVDDILIQAIDAELPDLQTASHFGKAPASRSGNRIKSCEASHGRCVRSSIERTRDTKVAVEATLRAAAPFQLDRRRREADQRGTASIPARSESQTERRVRPRVTIEPCDLRFKRFKHRAGVLFIFAVDASGSMAVNRIAQAKGALTRLLHEAYLHRDKVALISFRGDESTVLLAPTRSVELAKRLVDALPAGGGTPIAAGVAKALDLARLARLQGMSRSVLVLFTDGRANVRLGLRNAEPNESAIDDELRGLGRVLAAERIDSVVVDTKLRFVSAGDGRVLSEMLGARYLYLPRADAATVSQAISKLAGRQQRL